MTAGDFDGDGDIDLVFGDHTDDNTLWLNNGSGTFSDSGQGFDADDTEGITSGDLDGDGTLDLIAGNNGGPNTIWFNS